MTDTIIVAVATHEDGPGYVIRAELRDGQSTVDWRVADGLCDGRPFAIVESTGVSAIDDLRRALGEGWSVEMAWSADGVIP